MVMKTLAILMFFMILSMTHTKNPLVVSIQILALSSTVFLGIFLLTGSSWSPLMLQMMFMGGVLVMFMVLSAILPNETTTYGGVLYSMTNLILILMLSTIFLWSTQSTQTESESMKIILMGASTVGGVATIILAYFLSFIHLIGESMSPLRSSFCHISLAL